MSCTFARKKPIMDSSEHTTIKKAKSAFCGITRFSVPAHPLSLRIVSFTSDSGDASRTIVDVRPRYNPGTQIQLRFDPDPTNPDRFIQRV